MDKRRELKVFQLRFAWLGAWLGIVTGFIEGAGFLLCQHMQWLDWSRAQPTVRPALLWISPAFDLLLFGACGLALDMLLAIVPGWILAVRIAEVFIFFLPAYDLVALTGRLHSRSAELLALGLAVVLARWFGPRLDRLFGSVRVRLPWLLAAVGFIFLIVEGGAFFKERAAMRQLPAAGARAPSVVLIVADTVRADHLSAYGYKRPTSRFLDGLARGGVLFEEAFSTSSWTMPAHASMFTGRFPYEHGAVKDSLDSRYPVIAEVLQNCGYQTAAFSGNYFYVTRLRGFGRGFIHFDDGYSTAADMACRTLYGRVFDQAVIRRFTVGYQPARRDAADITASSLRWLDSNRGRPFFLFLNYFDAHDPYLPPQPHRNRFSRSANVGGLINEYWGRGSPKLTTQQLQGEIDAYDGAVAYIDEMIAVLLAGLEERGLSQNTIVVFISDHGEQLGERGFFVHRNSLYRQVLHVPLIFHWPARIPAGVRVAAPVSIASLPATILDLLGGKQETFPGPSLTRYWTTPGTGAGQPLVLAELEQLPFKALRRYPVYHGWLKALVGTDYYSIRHEKLGMEIYDRIHDPEQSKNLINTPGGHEAAAKYEDKLWRVLHHLR